MHSGGHKDVSLAAARWVDMAAARYDKARYAKARYDKAGCDKAGYDKARQLSAVVVPRRLASGTTTSSNVMPRVSEQRCFATHPHHEAPHATPRASASM